MSLEKDPLNHPQRQLSEEHSQWLADFQLEMALLDAPRREITHWVNHYQQTPDIVDCSATEIAHEIADQCSNWSNQQNPDTFGICLASTSHFYFLFPFIGAINEILNRKFSYQIDLSLLNLFGLILILLFPWGTALCVWTFKNYHWHKTLLICPVIITAFVGLLFIPEYFWGRAYLKQAVGQINTFVALALYLLLVFALTWGIKKWATKEEQENVTWGRDLANKSVAEQNQAWLDTFYQQLCNQHLYSARQAKTQLKEVKTHLEELEANIPDGLPVKAQDEFGSPVVYAQEIAKNNLFAQRNKLLLNLYGYLFITILIGIALFSFLMDLWTNGISGSTLFSSIIGLLFEGIIAFSLLNSYQAWKEFRQQHKK